MTMMTLDKIIWHKFGNICWFWSNFMDFLPTKALVQGTGSRAWSLVLEEKLLVQDEWDMGFFGP